MASRESNRYSWNPIVNENVAKVALADRDSGKVTYNSTTKLLMAEFET